MSKVMKVHGDALSFLQGLPDDSVQLVYTSIMYADRRTDSYGGISPDSMAEYIHPFLVQMRRAIKPTGVIAINMTAGTDNGKRNIWDKEIAIMMYDMFELCNELLWVKKNPYPRPATAMGGLKNAYEVIEYGAKTRGIVFNPGAIGTQPKPATIKRALSHCRQDSVRLTSITKSGMSIKHDCSRKIVESGKLVSPSNAFFEPEWDSNIILGAVEGRDRGHPAVQPLYIAERLVLLFTNPGDLVVAPFAGSFTTCEAAARHDRPAIGVDRMKSALTAGAVRLNAAGIPHFNSKTPIRDLPRLMTR